MMTRLIRGTRKVVVISVMRTLFISVALTFASCSSFEKPTPEKFLSESRLAPKNEFVFSNGKEIGSLDPADAVTSPEIDIIKATYEGLTDLDTVSGKAVPSVALSWTHSDDFRVWRFVVRTDARWSNGDNVTAHDFVRAWKRLPARISAPSLSVVIGNVEGLSDVESKKQKRGMRQGSAVPNEVVAEDDFLLKVTLTTGDPDFPKVVSHPIFRPVHESIERAGRDSKPITNGAFNFLSIGRSEVVLDKAPLYWNSAKVKLDRVRFVTYPSPEEALEAYKSGAVDALTNFEFEPVALKLFGSYGDFQKAVYGAVNLYEFNTEIPPFNDGRVRAAFLMSVDVQKVVQRETQGSVILASRTSPLQTATSSRAFDPVKARALLESAGFSDGAALPRITLVVNRNDLQIRLARSLMAMWKEHLKVQVVLDVREIQDIEAIRDSGNFHIIRRGIVFPVESALVSERLLISSAKRVASGDGSIDRDRHLPLYFPVSHAFVKPSVKGFSLSPFGPISVKHLSVD